MDSITIKMSGIRTSHDAKAAYRAASMLHLAHPEHPTGSANSVIYRQRTDDGPRRCEVYRTKTMYRVHVTNPYND